ncbi:hypothetical protein P9G84_02580 [Brevibacillus centrosporus]|uniref:hypothetical protein n=1 Tax=Brevibacillus centrosporus TaxID=54910 RepID=UPI00114409CA|nr:hypothetical protein [Brevibacillus centrosporus]MEC2127880.1 hypothetical protein [Brevibacillus centrosporus]GED32125.1 hypothetical protein BCE02nite_32660 [Brevibacillus centrosporus]
MKSLITDDTMLCWEKIDLFRGRVDILLTTPPFLSPQRTDVAYVSVHGDFYEIYFCSTGKKVRKLWQFLMDNGLFGEYGHQKWPKVLKVLKRKGIIDNFNHDRRFHGVVADIKTFLKYLQDLVDIVTFEDVTK